MERFHNCMRIYGICGKTGKGVDAGVKWLGCHVDGRPTPALPAQPRVLFRCLARDVGGAGWDGAAPRGVVGRGHNSRVPHEWVAGARRGRPAKSRQGGGGRAVLGSGWRKPLALGGRPVLGGPSHCAPAPTADQVSPMSPSEPILPRWRMKCLCRRVKPSKSFISSWMVGGSSGRSAPLPPHCAHPVSPGPGHGLSGLSADLGVGLWVSRHLSLDSVSILIADQ